MFFSYEVPKKTYNSIAVIGCGTLGSVLSYLLAKKRIAKTLAIFDSDVVEEKNVTNQLYDPGDIGKKKVVCLKNKLKDYVKVEEHDYVITPYNVSSLTPYDVVIDTTDSLEVLRVLVKSTLSHVGFIKIRGTESMFGIISKEKFDMLSKVLLKKSESLHISTQPVRFESSFTACSLLIHNLAYSKEKNTIFFINLKDLNKVIERVDL